MKLIGVSGGSGSGKTTLASMVSEVLGLENSGILLQDSYYKTHSHIFKGDGSVNFDHPDALDWDLMIEHLKLLKQSKAVELPIYNFATHERESRTHHLEPKEYIIVDGILIFSIPKLVEQFDLKLFVDTPEPIRFDRRVNRDTLERGRTKEGVIAQYKATVLPMHNEFVEPGKDVADVVVLGDRPFDEAVVKNVLTENL